MHILYCIIIITLLFIISLQSQIFLYQNITNCMTQTNLSLFLQAVLIFFPNQQVSSFSFYQIIGGVNNWTKGLITSNGDYVVRIYNNGKDINKVKLQHELLLILQKIKKTFKTPQPLRIPGGEETIAVLKQGYPCCVIRKIDGKIPKQFTRQGMYNFGKAVSQLTNILSTITLSSQPIIKPYFDLYQVHHAIINKNNFLNTISSQDYDSVRESVDQLLLYINLIQSKLEQFHQNKFYVQLIHGDVHTDNILMKGDQIMGILDFQFVAKDWRAMDLAISLSKYVNQDNFVQIMKDFNNGYRNRNNLENQNNFMGNTLTVQELRAVPWLIVLRLVSNFVYFVGRVMANEESVDFCKEKIQLYRKRIDKLIPKIQEFQKTLLQK